MATVKLVHPKVKVPVVVDERAVPHLQRSGWHRAGSDAAPQPPAPQPAVSAELEKVIAYHPGTGGRAEVAAKSMPHLRQSGWVLESEWAEQEATQAATPATPRKKAAAKAAETQE